MAREAVDMEISALTKKGQGKVDKRVVAIEHTHTHQVFHVRTHCFGHMPKAVGSKKGGSWNREPSTCKKDEKCIDSVFSGTTSLSNLETHSEKR